MSLYKSFLIIFILVVVIVFGFSLSTPTSALQMMACPQYSADTLYTCGTNSYYDAICYCGASGGNGSGGTPGTPSTPTITVTTSPVTNITQTTATGGGTITITN
ncbi:MAG: hypothetical protein NT161_00080 [Candidatus Nomurabacteria bacterium]|nr:hypothetical protein [Candidatus Nomurabacteria bacterium]